MISVQEAQGLLRSHYRRGRSRAVNLRQAAGLVLSKPVVSPTLVPPFHNSAMDGYAVCFNDTSKFEIVGESAAGNPFHKELLPGQAVRIFTGAEVPGGANAVIMQEKSNVENGVLTVDHDVLIEGNHIRLAGSQNRAGDVLLTEGEVLTPAALGFLAGCGVVEVEVYYIPGVSVIITGNEIINPGTELPPGHVYECNSFSLNGALKPFGIEPSIRIVKDIESEVINAISEELGKCDLLLISGGVSVGDYDFVVPALGSLGVQQIFHKVKQKPAKPLYAGETEGKMVFGLPGNPASVLTSFYVYVLPWLRYHMGLNSVKRTAWLQGDFSKKPGLTQFLKGKVQGNKVEILQGQESYRMDGFAKANCLIEIPENLGAMKPGEEVKIIEF